MVVHHDLNPRCVVLAETATEMKHELDILGHCDLILAGMLSDGGDERVNDE